MIYIEIINKYLITDKEISNSINEIGLVIIDNYGRLLVESKRRYIDIPKITLLAKSKNKII